MSKTTTAALAARIDVLSVAMRELARLLAPAQAGQVIDAVNRLDAEVDLVVSGHTHQAHSCLIANKQGQPVRVTSSGQYARNLGDIDLTIDTRSKDVAAVSASILTTGTSTAENPALN